MKILPAVPISTMRATRHTHLILLDIIIVLYISVLSSIFLHSFFLPPLISYEIFSCLDSSCIGRTQYSAKKNTVHTSGLEIEPRIFQNINMEQNKQWARIQRKFVKKKT
jgi:hypothetical protein